MLLGPTDAVTLEIVVFLLPSTSMSSATRMSFEHRSIKVIYFIGGQLTLVTYTLDDPPPPLYAATSTNLDANRLRPS